MSTVTVAQITATLRKLPAEKLVVVYDFVAYLSERELPEPLQVTATNALDFMLASEAVLRRDWDRPEEDVAWANL